MPNSVDQQNGYRGYFFNIFDVEMFQNHYRLHNILITKLYVKTKVIDLMVYNS